MARNVFTMTQALLQTPARLLTKADKDFSLTLSFQPSAAPTLAVATGASAACDMSVLYISRRLGQLRRCCIAHPPNVVISQRGALVKSS